MRSLSRHYQQPSAHTILAEMMARQWAAALLGILMCGARLRSADCQGLAVATRVLVVGIDSHGEARIETFIGDSASGSETARFDVLASCLAAAGFKLHNSSGLVAHDEAPMEIVGGTERDAIPGVASVKGVTVLMSLVFIALAIAVGLSKHLEANPQLHGTASNTASAATSTSTLPADESEFEDQDDGSHPGVSSVGSSAVGRLSRAGQELRRLGGTGVGSRGYSQISPGGLSGSESDTGSASDVEAADQRAARIPVDDDEPRTPPLKDRVVDNATQSNLADDESGLEPEPETRGRAEAEAEAGSLDLAARP